MSQVPWNRMKISALLALVLSLLFSLPLRAQVGTADVLGTVTDPTGALVANAKVSVTNIGTAAVRSADTNERGEYVVNTLPNGEYSLKVRAQGFKLYEVRFTLNAGARARFDAKLQTGAVTEEVKVVANNVMALQTDTSTLTSRVEENAIQDMPLNNRNFVGALLLQPGITQGTGNAAGESAVDRRDSSAVTANGQSAAYNNQLVDGFDNNERISGLIGVRPSIDGIAEMKVDTSNYTAEYGRTAGGVINIITKSGTNQFHGSAYDYLRNDLFDAANYFSLAGTKPEYRQNNFGGSIGGPIKKDKTFFFADIEVDRIVEGITTNSQVPTDYERANPGDLSDMYPVVFSGPPSCGTPDGPPMTVPPSGPCQPLVIPSEMLNPIMLKYFNLYPHGNYVNTSGIVPTAWYDWAPNKTQKVVNGDIRIDQHFSASDTLFARYANNPVSTVYPGLLPRDPTTGLNPGGGFGNGGPSDTNSQNLQFDYLHIFKPTLLLDLKAGYTRVTIASTPASYGEHSATVLGIENAYDPAIPSTDDLMGAFGAWQSLGEVPDVPIFETNNTFQYSASLTYTRGSHNMKFGAGLIRRQANMLQGGGAGLFMFVPSPPYFNAYGNFLTGNAAFNQRTNPLEPTRFRAWEPHWYAQDDWRVNSKLSVNIGVRYDIFSPFTEAKGNYTNFVPETLSSGLGLQNFILGSPGSYTGAKIDKYAGVKFDFGNFAPRVGFAYTVLHNTVLRGGFGMSYFPPDTGASGGAHAPISVLENLNPPNFFNYFGMGANVGNGPVAITPIDLNTYYQINALTSLTAKPLNLRSSYVEQANLALEQAFGANSVTVAYVGVFGRQILRFLNLDQPNAPGAGNPPLGFVYAAQLPYLQQIAYNYNGGISSYNAMQLVYNRRVSAGLGVSANYTWSHGLGEVPSGMMMSGGATENDNPRLDYGNSAQDIRQRVTLSANYQLPFGASWKGIKGAVAKGWQLNSLYYWQTGLPFTVEDANQYCFANCDNPPAALNLPYTGQAGVSYYYPDVIAPTSVAKPSLTKWFNTAAFANPTPGTLGNERNNQLRGPRASRVDMSLLKSFDLVENYKLQFRAEVFNFVNHPVFGQPDANFQMGSPNFGTINSTADNPRQMQFALKLLF
jgi:hypothetical protein